jgi:REP element-mobilizing transposase RayT
MEDNAQGPAATPGFPLIPFSRSAPIDNLHGNLPHWRQEGVTYFVTFRLGDSLPQGKLAEWTIQRTAWLSNHPEPWTPGVTEEYWRLFPKRLEAWLDAGHGSCILRRPACRMIVEGAFQHFDSQRYILDEFVVMPNHVHLILAPQAEHKLSDILHSWKSYTSKQINQALGRTGPVWEKESFDHIVRNQGSLDHFRHYIRNNPSPRSRRSSP